MLNSSGNISFVLPSIKSVVAFRIKFISYFTCFFLSTIECRINRLNRRLLVHSTGVNFI